ncbi:unnamed protein product, partial [Prunus brigantina]
LQVRNGEKNYVWLDPSIRVRRQPTVTRRSHKVGPKSLCFCFWGILVIFDRQSPGVSFKQDSTRIPKWNLGRVISIVYINPEISGFRRARPASFPGRFLPPPVIDSGKTGHVRTTTLPSSSPSPSQSRSAVVVAGNRHETGRFGQFLTEFRGDRSPSSGHRFRQVRYGFLAIFRALAAGWVGFQRFPAYIAQFTS